MSMNITEAFVQQFADNFKHVAQQSVSRFEKACIVENGIVGESKSVNRLGKRAANRRTTRHADTPINDQPHSTRYVDLHDWDDGDMLDDQDKIRMLTDPTSDYVKAMVAALNRAKDDEFISALGGAARTKSGTASFAAGQQIAVGAAGLTKAKMIQARKLFRANEADEENGEELFMGYSSTALSDLLTDTTLTNSEVNTVLSLQSGQLKQGMLMGFTMIPSERFLTLAGDRLLYAWAKSGMTMGIGANIVTKIGEDPGKGFNVRVYAKMSIGAVRTEEEKVVEITCNE